MRVPDWPSASDSYNFPGCWHEISPHARVSCLSLAVFHLLFFRNVLVETMIANSSNRFG
eukprot:m.85014 g.85014  ORF g.85014 m.85014 type:complete len:59 (+) comp36421_c0_seq5:186-362(+)